MHPLSVVTGFFEQGLESWQGLNGSSLMSLQFARRLGHNLMWSIMCEDMPDPDNRVVLSPGMIDGSGMPAPKLIYRTSADARACLDFNCEQAAQVFRDAGAWATEANNPAPYNAHFMGTARMGDDPARSVVDRWGMSHDVPNLGVIDGSVFVTSGAVNPTTTICALALRTARHLIDNRGRIRLPDRPDSLFFDLKSDPDAAPPAVVPPPELTVGQVAALTALGDALIPPVADLPGAGTLLCGQGLLARVLGVRPDLAAPLLRALEKIDAATFHGLAATDPPAWMAALNVIAGGYYLHLQVRARIGYEGQVAMSVRPDNYPAYIAEGLLDHLLDGSWRARWETPQAVDTGQVRQGELPIGTG